ncbi:MAG: hypothetical protein IMZ53_09035 [Thermoplasmata archaeon]|nr:hypothetical protein [Thermoplasmata archaeon]MBE3140712.1 hypothetical protein [Thermoplasmata archaeon]
MAKSNAALKKFHDAECPQLPYDSNEFFYLLLEKLKEELEKEIKLNEINKGEQNDTKQRKQNTYSKTA